MFRSHKPNDHIVSDHIKRLLLCDDFRDIWVPATWYKDIHCLVLYDGRVLCLIYDLQITIIGKDQNSQL
jgi:hypothetical protein